MKVKISKSKLRQMVLEEAASLISESFSPMASRATPQIKAIARGGRLDEMWGESVETGSALIDFAQAYAGLGSAVQDQVNAVVGAYVNGGGPESDQFLEVVYEQNPNAISMAMDKVGRLIQNSHGLGDEGEMVFEALQAATEIYEQGDTEVEADARAAGDR
jgi:hypothetical protein